MTELLEDVGDRKLLPEEQARAHTKDLRRQLKNELSAAKESLAQLEHERETRKKDHQMGLSRLQEHEEALTARIAMCSRALDLDRDSADACDDGCEAKADVPRVVVPSGLGAY